MDLDEVDYKILIELQKNGRKSYNKIAKEVDVAEGTVYNRLEAMKEKNVFNGFIPDIDFSKLGYNIITLIGITSHKGGKIKELEKTLSQHKNVTSVYDVTGKHDVVILTKFKKSNQLDNFVKTLLAREDVKRTNTMLVLNAVKETHQINLEKEMKNNSEKEKEKKETEQK